MSDYILMYYIKKTKIVRPFDSIFMPVPWVCFRIVNNMKRRYIWLSVRRCLGINIKTRSTVVIKSLTTIIISALQ